MSKQGIRGANMFSRRHYQLFAHYIRELKDQRLRLQFMVFFLDIFRDDNVDFVADRFKAACGFDPKVFSFEESKIRNELYGQEAS